MITRLDFSSSPPGEKQHPAPVVLLCVVGCPIYSRLVHDLCVCADGRRGFEPGFVFCFAVACLKAGVGER